VVGNVLAVARRDEMLDADVKTDGRAGKRMFLGDRNVDLQRDVPVPAGLREGAGLDRRAIGDRAMETNVQTIAERLRQESPADKANPPSTARACSGR
jgi:hypothetical protein